MQTALAENPFEGHVFVFRGRRGDIIKVLWFDGQQHQALAVKPQHLDDVAAPTAEDEYMADRKSVV